VEDRLIHRIREDINEDKLRSDLDLESWSLDKLLGAREILEEVYMQSHPLFHAIEELLDERYEDMHQEHLKEQNSKLMNQLKKQLKDDEAMLLKDYGIDHVRNLPAQAREEWLNEFDQGFPF